MYYYLVGALKRRLMLELSDSFSRHPVYRKICPYIQNKFSFDSRPQHGIIIKGASGNKIQLSADNFLGTIESHVMLAFVGQPCHPLEWVREDLEGIRRNGLQTLPGVYYMEILSAPVDAGDEGFFVLDPLLTVTDEAVLAFQSGIEREAQLQQVPVAGTLRLYENRRHRLIEGVDYTVGARGQLSLLSRFDPGGTLTADYRYAGTSAGPFPFKWNTSDSTTLPGVVMAFGKRAEAGQRVAVVVYQDRVDTANAYGGKFEVSFDLDVLARDTDQIEEMADLVVLYLFGEKRSQLSLEGIEVVDVSLGGESEDVYDETGDLNYYQTSVSVQLQADWEIHVPLPLTISRATDTTPEGDLDPSISSAIQMISDPLFYSAHPVLANRNPDYERIT